MRRPAVLLVSWLAFVTAGQAQTPEAISYSAANLNEPSLQLRRALALTIDESSGCVFNRVNSVLRQRDQTLVVGNTGNTELCFFAPGGRFLRRTGRGGRGPGEYADITKIYTGRADSILVLDALLRRLSFLAPNGTFVRSFQIQPPSDTLGFVTRVAPLPDGSLIIGFSEIRTMAPRAEPVFIGQVLFRFGSEGSLISRIGRFPESEHFVQEVPRQFGGVAYWDLAFGKRFALIPFRAGFLGSDASEPVIRHYSPAGQVIALHRIPVPIRRVTKDDIEEYRAAVMRKVRPDSRSMSEAMIEQMPYPTTWPLFRNMLSDDRGRIWLEQYPAVNSTSSSWVVLDPARRSTRVFSVATKFTLLGVFANTACGVARDELDVESIQCYELRPE